MSTAFGLDLSGYGSGRSALARARTNSMDIRVTLMADTVFSRRLSDGTALAPVLAEEASLIGACLDEGPVYADIPLDLQDLPDTPAPAYAWQTAKRPVDRALGAMAPLGDRIGWPVARMRAILARMRESRRVTIGLDLFETYPAASLRRIGLTARGYKPRQAIRADGVWREAEGDGPLAALCTALDLEAADGTVVSDDEFDALVCAVTGAAAEADRLQGPLLEAAIVAKLADRYPNAPSAPPAGFAILAHRPKGKIILETPSP